FTNAYGLADKKQNIPNRIDTTFNLGSCNKMFTALAIAQLAEKGKLSFDDVVAKHLPDYANKDIAAKVTLHHLLTHTSGLGFYPFTHGSKTPPKAFSNSLSINRSPSSQAHACNIAMQVLSCSA